MAEHYFIGLATTGHDPALAIVDAEGKVIFAEASERPSQIKNAWGVPPDHPDMIAKAIDRWCEPDATFTIATSWAIKKEEAPIALGGPLLSDALLDWMGGLHSHLNRTAGDGIARLRGRRSIRERIALEHHLCHATFAYHTAPFDDGLCVVIDGEGDVGSISVYGLTKGRPKRIKRSWGPGSLGYMYGWLTDACGFDWTKGEQWKVMGLAAFADPPPELSDALGELLTIKDATPLLAEDEKRGEIAALVKRYERRPCDDPMKAAPLAAAAQAVFTRLADEVIKAARVKHPSDSLILAGGCALNSSYNGRVADRLGFANLHVPSAPGDDGNAVGAALAAWLKANPDRPLPKHALAGKSAGAFLGSEPCETALKKVVGGATGFAVRQSGSPAVEAASLLAQGRILGVMRGRAEFGPRALGHRSILADPRRADVKDRINAKVKGREAYRPFAPVVLDQDTQELFQHARPSPYMSLTLPWRSKAAAEYPATVHQDQTGRLQTVEPTDWLGQVLTQMNRQTGSKAILNTSLNVMGRPIVHSVEDAITVLATTGMEALMIDDWIFEKAATPK